MTTQDTDMLKYGICTISISCVSLIYFPSENFFFIFTDIAWSGMVFDAIGGVYESRGHHGGRQD